MAYMDEVASHTGALTAPTDPVIIRLQSLVIAITAILSILGAAWIIASFSMFRALRSFRHFLILGLAISDCAMAFNFLLSSSMNVDGHWIGAPEQARFCNFNGFVTQVFVIQTDYWVFIIAVYTYFILADHRRCLAWTQGHPAVVWILPWLLSVTWATIGLGVAGYGDIGAWCWFTSDWVRLLVNFVPRWLIIVAMFLVYARLYIVLYGAHRHILSLSSGNSGSITWPIVPSRQLSSSGVSQQDAGVAPFRITIKLKKLARRMLLYPLAYAIVWLLPTIIRIYQTVRGQPAPWQVQTIGKACIVIQGLIDAVIYGATESSLSSWRGLLFPPRSGEIVIQPADEQDGAVVLDRRTKNVHQRSRSGDGSDSRGLSSPRVSVRGDSHANNNRDIDSANSRGIVDKHADKSGSSDQVEVE